MGNEITKIVEPITEPMLRLAYLEADRQGAALNNLVREHGQAFPGSNYHPHDRKNWMGGLDPGKVCINQIVWPGTHHSATNGIGIPVISMASGQCQNISVYDQLVKGVRVLDVRVNKGRNICHGGLVNYGVDVVIKDVKRFLSETKSEIIILEVRTEFGQTDPLEFGKYLEEQLGDLLIYQNDQVFQSTIAQLLPRRVICVWKPRNSPEPLLGGHLWGATHLKDHWFDTNLPRDKFEENLQQLHSLPSVSTRNFFYKTENTLTPNFRNPLAQDVERFSERIRGFARYFISRCFQEGCGDKVQIFSTDYIQDDFVHACVGATFARIQDQLRVSSLAGGSSNMEKKRKNKEKDMRKGKAKKYK